MTVAPDLVYHAVRLQQSGSRHHDAGGTGDEYRLAGSPGAAARWSVSGPMPRAGRADRPKRLPWRGTRSRASPSLASGTRDCCGERVGSECRALVADKGCEPVSLDDVTGRQKCTNELALGHGHCLGGSHFVQITRPRRRPDRRFECGSAMRYSTLQQARTGALARSVRRLWSTAARGLPAA